MKNNPQVMHQRSEIKISNWLCQETQEDDFLMGKTPKDLGDTWEEEE